MRLGYSGYDLVEIEVVWELDELSLLLLELNGELIPPYGVEVVGAG